MSEKISKLTEELSKLTVLEAAELSKELEERWGVSASMPAAAAAPAAAEASAPEAEKTEFDIYLSAVGEKKLNVIKEIKDITQLDLKSSKEIVESAPKIIKSGISKEEVEKIKSKLEAVGAKVEVK